MDPVHGRLCVETETESERDMSKEGDWQEVTLQAVGYLKDVELTQSWLTPHQQRQHSSAAALGKDIFRLNLGSNPGFDLNS